MSIVRQLDFNPVTDLKPESPNEATLRFLTPETVTKTNVCWLPVHNAYRQECHRSDGGCFSVQSVAWHTISIHVITSHLYFSPLIKVESSGIFHCEVALFFSLLLWNYVNIPSKFHLLFSVWGLGFLSYWIGYSVLLSLFVLMFKLFQISPESFQPGSCVLWTCPHHSLSMSLISGTRCSKLIMFSACPSPEISRFSKDLWFCLLVNGIRNLDLSAKCVPCYWNDFASTWHSKEICVCIISLVYTHLCTSFCIPLYLYQTEHEFLLMSNSN